MRTTPAYNPVGRANSQGRVLERKIGLDLTTILALQHSLFVQLRGPLSPSIGEHIMPAEKAVRFPTAYGYAVAAACAALAAWGAANPPSMRGIVRAIAESSRDTQLPLERLAIETSGSPSLPPFSQLKAWQQLSLSWQVVQPSTPSRRHRRMSTSIRDESAEMEKRFSGQRASQSKNAPHGYYRKIEDWKNWT
jgi:hypothetical protein